MLAVLTATVLIATPVLAFPPGPDNDNSSPFNALDAVPTCDPTPDPDLNTPTTGSDVTDEDCTEPAGTPPDPAAIPITISWIWDTVSGTATDNAWGQGDKSDCYLAKTGGVSGACVTQVFGIGAAKTDLQYHGIGLETGIDGHTYLYSGIKRLQAGGVTSSNANYNVEVNQLLDAYEPAAPICDGTNTNGCNIWRSPGDLTFMTDWGGNKSSCDTATPAICAYVWIDKSVGTGKTPSPAGATCFNAKTDPCWGLLPGGDAALSANPNKAAGSINADALVQPYTFSEIGIDLTASGLVEEGACETFKNVWAHSRSSSSFTAELKDFIFGDVTIDTCTTTSTSLHERTNSTGDTDVTPSNNGANITVLTGAYVNDVATVGGNSPTGSVAFKYYPSLADCTADTNGVSAGGGAVSSGSATSSTVQFNTVGTFYWVATFTGTGGTGSSASVCGDEILTVRQNSGTTTFLHERTDSTGDTDVTPSNNGASITVLTGAYVNDVATVTPSGATGTVAFKYYPSLADCTADENGVAAGSGLSLSTGTATSSTVQFNSVGTFYWKAFFTGSGLTNSSASVCGDEILTVRQNSGTTTFLHERTNSTGDTDVTPSNNGLTITVLTGAYVNDVATVTPSGATGTVAFKYYPSLADCTADENGVAAGSGLSLSTGTATSSTVQFNSVGTFYWKAFFTGSGLTNSSASVCGDEILTVRQNSGTTTFLHERTNSTGDTDVTPSNNGLTITVLTGAYVNDVATVTPSGATGTVAFKYYPSLADCTADENGVAAGSGLSLSTGTATSSTVQFNSVGTFYWKAFFTGSGLTNSSASVCGDEILTVRQNSGTTTFLHERTNSTGDTDVTPSNNGASITVNVGAYVNDVATVTPSGATGTVAFKYYPSLADCTADENGVAAGSGLSLSTGTATSSTVQFNSVGTFYWKAFFTGSGSTNSSASVCGDEILTVQQVNTAISTSPWYYPNDSATLSAPNGGGTLTGSIKFDLYGATTAPAATALANCLAGGDEASEGLLYSQAPLTVSGPGPYLTTNTSVAVSSSGTVVWRVTFTSTNPAQIGRNSVCVESINATLTGDSPGTAGNAAP